MTDAPKGHRDGEYAICPYCGNKHGDCWEWVTDRDSTHECGECGREFVVYADYNVTYITRPAANGGGGCDIRSHAAQSYGTGRYWAFIPWRQG